MGQGWNIAIADCLLLMWHALPLCTSHRLRWLHLHVLKACADLHRGALEDLREAAGKAGHGAAPLGRHLVQITLALVQRPVASLQGVQGHSWL